MADGELHGKFILSVPLEGLHTFAIIPVVWEHGLCAMQRCVAWSTPASPPAHRAAGHVEKTGFGTTVQL